MMNLTDFKRIFCNVSLIDNRGFGLYPFPMLCVTKGKEIKVYTLALDIVQEYYNVFLKMLFEENILIHLAVDFPCDEADFLQVFTYDDGNYSYELLSYSKTTGEFIPNPPKVIALGEQIFSQFKQHILNAWKRKS
jgi:hypothetical protein